jgi:hypothetical protein
MAETREISGNEGADLLGRAAPVIERVKILSILLAESQIRRSPSADLRLPGLKTEFLIHDVEVGSNADDGHIFVFLTFALRVSKPTDGEEQAEAMVSIDAKYVLIYSADNHDGLDDEALGAFGATNGVYNAWPYWREFVQSCTLRMGLQGIVVPLFRPDVLSE